jgi:hypothetical protein
MGHARVARARKTMRVQQFGSNAYSRRQLFLNAAIAASRVGLSERVGVMGITKSLIWVPPVNRFTRVPRGLSQCTRAPGDWMAVRRFDGDSE